MAVLAWITGIILIMGFGGSGAMKIIDHEMMQGARNHFGIEKQKFQGLGVLEVLGAIGVLIGLLVNNGSALEFLGPLAAAGLVIVGVGAFIMHQRKGDAPKDAFPPLVLAVVAVVYIIAIFARANA